MLHPDYPIHTARLSLRPPVVADAEAVAAYKSRPAVCRSHDLASVSSGRR